MKHSYQQFNNESEQRKNRRVLLSMDCSLTSIEYRTERSITRSMFAHSFGHFTWFAIHVSVGRLLNGRFLEFKPHNSKILLKHPHNGYTVASETSTLNIFNASVMNRNQNNVREVLLLLIVCHMLFECLIYESVLHCCWYRQSSPCLVSGLRWFSITVVSDFWIHETQILDT